MKQKILIIVGPTSSGKSSLAVELARKLNGEVISADSRQVYKGLDIGTGKITKREMKGVRHHLLDVANPKRNFTAHEFIECGRKTIDDIVSRGKLPIIAGGTGFYIDALVGRIALPDVSPNPQLRTQLEKKTAHELFMLLKKRDQKRARVIDSHNKRRLIRALEIVSALGAVPKATENSLMYEVVWVGISPNKEDLEKAIKKRLTARIRQGMIKEAQRLRVKGLSYKRMETLGLEYRALARLLQKKISRKEFEEELFRDIRRYAKRQMTYWKRNKHIRWFVPAQKQKLMHMVRFLVH